MDTTALTAPGSKETRQAQGLKSIFSPFPRRGGRDWARTDMIGVECEGTGRGIAARLGSNND